jgi:hypothetical protein
LSRGLPCLSDWASILTLGANHDVLLRGEERWSTNHALI